MSEFVKIVYGDSPAVVVPRSFDKVCIIGKSAGFTSVVDNISVTDLDPTNITVSGLVITDPLYIAAMEFFVLDPSGTLVLAGIPLAAGSNIEKVELTLTEAGIWSSGYSPVTTITDIEIYPTADNEAMTAWGSGEGWYTVDHGIDVVEENGVKPGTVELSGTTIDFTDFTGYTWTTGDRLRCTVEPSTLSAVFGLLTQENINFEVFAFAYDSSLGTGAALVTDKYFTTNCIGGSSWLHDVVIGKNMCGQFNAAGQRCLFAFGLPEKVRASEEIIDLYTAGTPYTELGTGKTILYEELREKVGANKFISGWVTKQASGSTAVDPAIAAIASISKSAKRDMITFYQETIANDDWPNGPERAQWKNAQINSFIYIKEGGAMCWGSNKTFGVGYDSDINYIRCKNIMAYRISEALHSLLYTRSTKYDLAGMESIRATIQGVMTAAVGLYIDGIGTVTIPIETTLRTEASLSVGEKATLAGVRLSKKVSNVAITYLWKGDVEDIEITTFVGE